ncbi:MAG: hypothetical protein ACLFQA_00400 [Bacteroidales bacterium]
MAYIDMAAEMFEGETGMILMDSVIEQIIPAGEKELIIKTEPFFGVIKKVYTKSGGVEAPITDCTLYDKMPSILELDDIYDVPVYVQYEAGYESNDLIPADIRGAMLLLVGRIYANPEDPIDKSTGLASKIIRKYKVYDR